MPTSSRLRLGAAALALSLGATAGPLRAADPAPAPHAPAARFGPPVVEKLRTQTEPETTNLTGRVMDTSVVALGDAGAKHRVAWVRDDHGAVHPVDLGPADGDAARAVKVGDKVTVTGQNFPVVQTRKAEMLFASRVKVRDNTVAVGPGQAAKPQDSAEQKPQTLAGKVLRTKRVEWKGSDRRELVVLVKTADGKEVPADLGPTTAFQGAGVRTGEDITLRGKYVKLGDKEVFFADEVVRGDKKVSISRSVPKRDAAQAAGATAQKLEALPKPENNRHVLDGIVRAVRNVPRKDGGASLVVLLEGPDHRFAYADLGNATAPGKPVLVAGDELTVSGPVVHVQKKPLIMADSWSMGGKTHWIKR
jgi:hypothetical protein